MNQHFIEVDQARYWEMLEILPPAYMDGKGFLVGEPFTHRRCEVSKIDNQPTFAPFIEHAGKFYEGEQAMTIREYKALDVQNVVRMAQPTLSRSTTQEPTP